MEARLLVLVVAVFAGTCYCVKPDMTMVATNTEANVGDTIDIKCKCPIDKSVRSSSLTIFYTRGDSAEMAAYAVYDNHDDASDTRTPGDSRSGLKFAATVENDVFIIGAKGPLTCANNGDNIRCLCLFRSQGDEDDKDITVKGC